MIAVCKKRRRGVNISAQLESLDLGNNEDGDRASLDNPLQIPRTRPATAPASSKRSQKLLGGKPTSNHKVGAKSGGNQSNTPNNNRTKQANAQLPLLYSSLFTRVMKTDKEQSNKSTPTSKRSHTSHDRSKTHRTSSVSTITVANNPDINGGEDDELEIIEDEDPTETIRRLVGNRGTGYGGILNSLSIGEVFKLRSNAEKYIKIQVGRDPTRDHRYFHGPRGKQVEKRLCSARDREARDELEAEKAARKKNADSSTRSSFRQERLQRLQSYRRGSAVQTLDKHLEKINNESNISDQETIIIKDKLNNNADEKMGLGNARRGSVKQADSNIGEAAGEEQATVASKRKFNSNYRQFGKTDFAASEKLLKQSFAWRATAFGFNNNLTHRCRENLYRCYLAQVKEMEANELRNKPGLHLANLLADGVLRYNDDHNNERKETESGDIATHTVRHRRPKGTLGDSVCIVASGKWCKDFRFADSKNLKIKDEVVFDETMTTTRPGTAPAVLQVQVTPTTGNQATESIASPMSPLTISELAIGPLQARIDSLMNSAAFTSPIHTQVRDMMLMQDYKKASEVACKGLIEHGDDRVLEALFKASLHATADYPRWADFRARVILKKDGDNTKYTLGDKLVVSYTYIHESNSKRPHTLRDRIGLFRLPDLVKFNRSNNFGSMATLLRSRTSATSSTLKQDAEEELIQWIQVPPPNSGKIGFDGVPSQPGRYVLRYLVHGSDCALGKDIRFQAEHATVELHCTDQVICSEQMVVKYNVKVSSFEHHPDDTIGLYAVGPEGVDHLLRDWKKKVESVGAHADSNFEPVNLMEDNACLALVKLPAGNTGTVEFNNVPLLPGIFEFRMFDSQFGKKLIGTSNPVSALAPRTFRQTHIQHKLRRQVRVFICSTLCDFDEERQAILDSLLPRLHRYCQDRRLALTIVDLCGAVGPDDIESGPSVETLLREIDMCRPYAGVLLGERYGWVPPAAGVLENLTQTGKYPWMHGHANAMLDVSRGKLGFSMLEMLIFYLFLLPSAELVPPKVVSGHGYVEGANGLRLKTVEIDEDEDEIDEGNAAGDLSNMPSVSIAAPNVPKRDQLITFRPDNCTIFVERHPALTLRNEASTTKLETSAREGDMAMRDLKARIGDAGANLRSGFMSSSDIVESLLHDLKGHVEREFPAAETPIGPQFGSVMLSSAIELWALDHLGTHLEVQAIVTALDFYTSKDLAELPWKLKHIMPQVPEASVGGAKNSNKDSVAGGGANSSPAKSKNSGRPTLLTKTASTRSLRGSRKKKSGVVAASNGIGNVDVPAAVAVGKPEKIQNVPLAQQVPKVPASNMWLATPLMLVGEEGCGADEQVLELFARLYNNSLRTSTEAPLLSEASSKKILRQGSLGHALSGQGSGILKGKESGNSQPKKGGIARSVLKKSKSTKVCEDKNTELLRVESELSLFHHTVSHNSCGGHNDLSNQTVFSPAKFVTGGNTSQTQKVLHILVPIGLVPGLSSIDDVVRHIIQTTTCALSLAYIPPVNTTRMLNDFSTRFLPAVELAGGSLVIGLLGLDRLAPDEYNSVEARSRSNAITGKSPMRNADGSAVPSYGRSSPTSRHTSNSVVVAGADLRWLPAELNPDVIRIIATTQTSGISYEVMLERRWNVVQVGALIGTTTVNSYVEKVVGRLDLAVDCVAVANHICQSAKLLSSDPYKKSAVALLPAHIDVIVKHAHARGVLNASLPLLAVQLNVEEMLEVVIEDVERISEKLVQDLLCLLWCVPKGLEEMELMRILGIVAVGASRQGGEKDEDVQNATTATADADADTVKDDCGVTVVGKEETSDRDSTLPGDSDNASVHKTSSGDSEAGFKTKSTIGKQKHALLALKFSRVALALTGNIITCVNGCLSLAGSLVRRTVEARYSLDKDSKTHLKILKRLYRFFAPSGDQTTISNPKDMSAHIVRCTEIVPHILQQIAIMGPRDYRRVALVEQTLSSLMSSYDTIFIAGLNQLFFGITAWAGIPFSEGIALLRKAFDKKFEIQHRFKHGSKYERLDISCFVVMPILGEGNSNTPENPDDVVDLLEDDATLQRCERKLRVVQGEGVHSLVRMAGYAIQMDKLKEALTLCESAVLLSWGVSTWSDLEVNLADTNAVPISYTSALIALRHVVEIAMCRALPSQSGLFGNRWVSYVDGLVPGGSTPAPKVHVYIPTNEAEKEKEEEENEEEEEEEEEEEGVEKGTGGFVMMKPRPLPSKPIMTRKLTLCERAALKIKQQVGDSGPMIGAILKCFRRVELLERIAGLDQEPVDAPASPSSPQASSGNVVKTTDAKKSTNRRGMLFVE